MFYVSVSTVHINLNFWIIILNYATTCVRQLEVVHMNLGEGGRWSRYFFAFTNSPHCNWMDVCSRCSLVHCSFSLCAHYDLIQEVADISGCLSTDFGDFGLYHSWLLMLECKGSCINTAFFTLWGFIFYLFVYWAEIVLENATRPSNCCQKIPVQEEVSPVLHYDISTRVVQITSSPG